MMHRGTQRILVHLFVVAVVVVVVVSCFYGPLLDFSTGSRSKAAD